MNGRFTQAFWSRSWRSWRYPCWQQQKKRDLLGVAVFGLIFSLGDQAPFMVWIARLPGFQLLRVPARAVILVQFSMLTLASMAVDGLSAPVAAKAKMAEANFVFIWHAFASFFCWVYGA